MNVYTWTGAVIGIAMFAPTLEKIRKGHQQSFASWMLWALIAGIATISVAKQKGNYMLSAAYYFCDGMTAFACLIDWRAMQSRKIKLAKFRWTWIESATLFLVASCIIVWIAFGARAATIMSTASHLIAGIPQLVETYQKPANTNWAAYFGFFLAGMLSALGGSSWSAEQVLYPYSTGLYCLTVSLVALTRRS